MKPYEADSVIISTANTNPLKRSVAQRPDSFPSQYASKLADKRATAIWRGCQTLLRIAARTDQDSNHMAYDFEGTDAGAPSPAILDTLSDLAYSTTDLRAHPTNDAAQVTEYRQESRESKQMTEPLYQTDAYLKEFDAHITAVDGQRVALDRTAFYATGGGQPNDIGTLTNGTQTWQVTDVRREGDNLWHTLSGEGIPAVGDVVTGQIDWQRRYRLMQTHTALHLLCGVIWRDYKAAVTGGNMDTDEGRLDFELRDFSNELAQEIVTKVNTEIAAARPVEVKILPRDEAFQIPDLIRTKINLLPEGIQLVRTVNIVGLDLQADGGTHVANTREVGRVTLLKTRSKGANNKRIIIGLEE